MKKTNFKFNHKKNSSHPITKNLVIKIYEELGYSKLIDHLMRLELADLYKYYNYDEKTKGTYNIIMDETKILFDFHKIFNPRYIEDIP